MSESTTLDEGMDVISAVEIELQLCAFRSDFRNSLQVDLTRLRPDGCQHSAGLSSPYPGSRLIGGAGGCVAVRESRTASDCRPPARPAGP